MPVFVLIHSPLVGPLTWMAVAAELHGRGYRAVVPALSSPGGASQPYWSLHAGQVDAALVTVPAEESLILVGHSGGGMLLPAVRQLNERQVAGYVFADAGIPRDGKSRLDIFDPAGAAEFRAAARDGIVMPWNEEDLREVLPDPELRARFVAELRPMPLAVYEEPLPVFAGWPDAPCAYLQFSPAYDPAAVEARRAGWPYRRLDGGHFHMLVEPAAVADAILELAGLPAWEAQGY